MNYYGARQRQSDKQWVFTRRNDDQIWAVGYCAEQEHAHGTKEETEACYHKYLLDKWLRLDGKMSGQQQKCQVCGEWTQGFAELGDCEMFVLCDEHRNREQVEKLTEPSTEIISSW